MLTGKQGSGIVKAIHVICHYENGEPRHLRPINPVAGIYGSGWWGVSHQDAQELVGGWMYLHESSNQRSYFIGRVQSLGPEPRDDGR